MITFFMLSIATLFGFVAYVSFKFVVQHWNDVNMKRNITKGILCIGLFNTVLALFFYCSWFLYYT